MHRTLTLAVAGLLAAGPAFADPPELIPLKIPEARLAVFASNAAGCPVQSGLISLANGESRVVEGECPPGQPVSFEVGLIENAVVVTLPSVLDSVGFQGTLLNIIVPNLAPTVPVVFGSPDPPLSSASISVELVGQAGGTYPFPLQIVPSSRSTVMVLGGDTVNPLVTAGWSPIDGKFRFEVSTAAPPPSAISREEFDELQQRLSRIESLPGIARRLARVPGLELALLLLPGAWLYRRSRRQG